MRPPTPSTTSSVLFLAATAVSTANASILLPRYPQNTTTTPSSSTSRLDLQVAAKATTTASSASSTSTPSYVFNPDSKDNLAVYYGSTNATSTTNLSSLCANPSIDIVILTFVTEILNRTASDGVGYPSVDFANLNCTGQTSEMVADNATGLVWCTTLADEISNCQEEGKKVLLSIGGAEGNVTFDSESQANKSAEVVWDIFGAGAGSNISYRPFGDSVVDGFDIDNESGNSTYWPTFTAHLRTLFASHPQKTFYLSAAPQCYYPSPSAPLDMLTQLDFVWPQFYDSATCGVSNADGFNSSLQAWSQRLDTGNKPKLLVGALTFDDGGLGGYEDAAAFEQTVEEVKKMDLTNFGGVMLWDGGYGVMNDTDIAGEDYVDVTKQALESSATSVLVENTRRLVLLGAVTVSFWIMLGV